MSGTRLVVFDLDGTLIDSHRDLAASANALIVERGGTPLPESAVSRMIGEGAAVLVRRALTAAGLEVSDRDLVRFLQLYDERLLDTTVAYPGMRAAMDELARSATLAVLTNKPLAPARRLLDALNLSAVVAETVGGDGRHARKPDPASLLWLMQRFGAAPSATVMVGDTPIDFRTAGGAGTWFCLARYGFGFEQFPVEMLTGREAVVDAPAEIPKAINSLLDTGLRAP